MSVISDALAPYANSYWAVPYAVEPPNFAIRGIVLRARAKAAFGMSGRGGALHRPHETVTVCDGYTVGYGARWMCGARTNHAILISEADATGRKCPRCEEAIRPVVYRCYDADDQLLYIGSTKFRTARMKTHAIQSWEWWGDVARIADEIYPTVTQARMAEWQAILDEQPLHNKTGKRAGAA